jgi:arylsulfatase A-like enzyme
MAWDLVSDWTDWELQTDTVTGWPGPACMAGAAAGHGDIGYHNVLLEDLIKTPALDRLAATGIKLEHYYVQPICTPTRSQLMSGRYQIHTGLQHGVINPTRPMGLPTDIPIIANVLKDLGYRTHLVGKVK